jgi:hypothetical protein
MQVINKETGEISNIEPYRLHQWREGLRPRATKKARTMKRSCSYRLRHQHAAHDTWCNWLTQLTTHVGPMVLGLTSSGPSSPCRRRSELLRPLQGLLYPSGFLPALSRGLGAARRKSR